MTPRSLEPERLPRPSRRALVLGAAGVLAGAAVMAALGFTAGSPPLDRRAPAAAPSSSSSSQLETLPLSEVRGHKPLP